MVLRGERIAPIYISSCVCVLVIWLAVYVKTQEGNSLGIFDCHGDPCKRGVHYCAEDVGRCELCSEKRNECDTSSIPRDCDRFCSNLKLESLNKEIAVVNATRFQLENDNKRLKESIKECRESKHHITLVLGLTGGVFIIATLALSICICWLRKRKKTYATQLQDDKKEKESLVSKDSAVDLESQDGKKEKQPEGATSEDAGRPSQDVLKSIPPTSPGGTYQQVFNN